MPGIDYRKSRRTCGLKPQERKTRRWTKLEANAKLC
jgi:hypothetical protein